MAHYWQPVFVEEVKLCMHKYFKNAKVLEVGSYDANGSVRKLFGGCDYVGVDIAEGPGVDLVCRGEDLSLPSGSFDIVVSCECFEHNVNWRDTLSNMKRMLSPGGLLIVTFASLGRAEHGTARTTPSASLTATSGDAGDYYANISKASLLRTGLMQGLSFKVMVNPYARDLYLLAIKPPCDIHARALLSDVERRVSIRIGDTFKFFKSSFKSHIGLFFRFFLFFWVNPDSTIFDFICVTTAFFFRLTGPRLSF